MTLLGSLYNDYISQAKIKVVSEMQYKDYTAMFFYKTSIGQKNVEVKGIV